MTENNDNRKDIDNKKRDVQKSPQNRQRIKRGCSREERNKGNNSVKIAMVILSVLLAGLILVYAYNIFWGSKKKSTESVKESVNENRPTDVLNNTIKETEKESIKETMDETVKESNKETIKESVKETLKESTNETQKETQRESQKEEVKETNQEADNGDYTKQEIPAYDKTVNISIDKIKSASEKELVDMIIRGELGYGWERLDLLQKAGLNPNHIGDLVNKRLKELGY